MSLKLHICRGLREGGSRSRRPGHRVRKTVYRSCKVPSSGNGFDSAPSLDAGLLSDGWNLVARPNATYQAIMRGCVWGTDLSGTPQGKSGVGGLLAVPQAGALRRQLKLIELRLVKVETWPCGIT